MKYIAQPYKENSYIVSNHKRNIGILLYKGFFKTNVSFTLKSADNLKYNRYRIKSDYFWKPTFYVSCGNDKIMEITSTWSSNSIVKTNFNNISEQFVYRKKSLFSTQFILEDSDGNVLLNVSSHFQWRKLRFNHTIVSNETFENREYKDIIFMSLIFYTNYMVTVAMAATS